MNSRGAKNRFHYLESLVSYGAAIFLLTIPAIGLSAPMDYRPICCVGYHYPALQNELYSQIETFIKLSPPKADLSKIHAIIVPNDPFVYVGPILGSAYSNIANKSYDRIVILGFDPSATAPALYIGSKFSTSLGQLRSDDSFARQLAEKCKVKFEVVPVEFSLPASIEAQLPFLQYLYGERAVVAVGLSGQSSQDALEIGRTLGELIRDGKSLIIAVSNLSNLYDSGACEGLDRALIARVRCFEVDKLAEDFEQGRIEAQSPAVLIAALSASRDAGADYVEILRYANSGGIIGDHQSAVGYLSAAIGNSKAPAVKKCPTHTEGATYIQLAKRTVYESLGMPHKFSKCPENRELKLDGLYLTIEVDGKLRGASSLLFPTQFISEAVSLMAKTAAFNDPRFNPIGAEELAGLSISLYIFSNARRIETPALFDARKDAIFVRKGSYSALLLPGELNPNLSNEDILGRVCIKAGMLSNCWRQSETSIWSFDVQNFTEEK